MASTRSTQQQQAHNFSLTHHNINFIKKNDNEILSTWEKLEQFKLWQEMGCSSSPTVKNTHSKSGTKGLFGMMNDIPRIPKNDISITKLLGRGSFANVKQGIYNNKSFAIKLLRPSVVVNKESLRIAAMDLASEAVILSNLRHKNIISILGVNEGDTDALVKKGKLFIALEIINDTLEDRLKEWKKHQKFMKVSFTANSSILNDRLKNVAMGIVSAMQYLHSNRIIYRDMKPSNIGFNDLNQVKIFDFGFARVCNTQDGQGSANSRLMTGGVGTPRYMAPEVMRHDETYGFPVDVYSFSLLLWQMITAKTPYKNIKNAATLARKVVLENERPCLRLVRSESIRELLKCSWSADPNERPSFSEIRKALDKIIEKDNGNKTSLRKRCSIIGNYFFSSQESSNNDPAKVSINTTENDIAREGDFKESLTYNTYTTTLNDRIEDNKLIFCKTSSESSDETISFTSTNNLTNYSDDGSSPIRRKTDRGIRCSLPLFHKKRRNNVQLLRHSL